MIDYKDIFTHINVAYRLKIAAGDCALGKRSEVGSMKLEEGGSEDTIDIIK